MPTLLAVVSSALVVLPLTAQQFVGDDVPWIHSQNGLLAMLDVNGDGLDDAVTFTDDSAMDTWLRFGPARFRLFRQRATPAVAAPLDRRAVVGDVDLDGDEDLLVASATNAPLLFRDVGSRLDPTGVELPAIDPGRPTTYCFLDVDADGDLDVFGSSTSRAGVLANNGQGTFASWGGPVPSGRFPTKVRVADVDRDGRSDLIGRDRQGGMLLWRNQSTGLVDETVLRLTAAPAVIGDLAVADIDNDGDVDLFGSYAALTDRAWWLRNDGTGRFIDASSLLSPMPYAPGAPLAFDDDGDGDLDLLIGANVLRQSGGVFAYARGVAVEGVMRCDLDGDRHDDWVDEGALVRNDGGISFVPLIPCNAVGAVDVDGDGDLDPLARGLRFTQEGGTRRIDLRYAGYQNGVYIDLDQDGDVDLAAPDYWGNWGLWANDGTGMYQFARTLPATQPANTALGTDVDADYDTDLLLFGSGLPTLLRNDGNLTFTNITATAFPTPQLTLPIAAAGDLDGDSDVDFVFGDGTVSRTFLNDGYGVFAAEPQVLPGSFQPTLAQLDRDVEVELLLARGSTVALYDRVGNNWTDLSTRLPPPRFDVRSLICRDFDGDGALDLLLTSSAVSLFLNNGTGTFRDATAERGPLPTACLAAADIDGDGDPEILDGRHVWINRHRQLEVTTMPILGGRLALSFVGEPGYGSGAVIAVPTLGLVRSSRGRPWVDGRFLPEPAGSVPLAAMVSAFGQTATSSLPIPNDQALSGLRLQIQGVVIDSVGRLALANHIALAID
ncbi:MAG: VCBS repeat-containing protein [Planctomycetes bacterium]|nr:VCBS repeat-containing protein [Planctomycetota bacterium]